MKGVWLRGHAELPAARQNIQAVFPELGFQVIGRHFLPFASGLAALQLGGAEGGHVLLQGPDGFGVVQVLQGAAVLGMKARHPQEHGSQNVQQSFHYELIRIQPSCGQTSVPRISLSLRSVSSRLLDGQMATASSPFRKLMMVAV